MPLSLSRRGSSTKLKLNYGFGLNLDSNNYLAVDTSASVLAPITLSNRVIGLDKMNLGVFGGSTCTETGGLIARSVTAPGTSLVLSQSGDIMGGTSLTEPVPTAPQSRMIQP